MTASAFPLEAGTRQTDVLTGDGATVTFGPFGFKIFSGDDVEVLRKDLGQDRFSVVSNYTVNLSGSYNTFTISWITAPPASSQFYVRGKRVQQRSMAPRKANQVDPTAIDKELTTIGVVLQEQTRSLDQAVTAERGVTPPVFTEALTEGRLLAAGADNALKNSVLDEDEIAAVPGLASAAAASQAAAAGSASAAAGSAVGAAASAAIAVAAASASGSLLFYDTYAAANAALASIPANQVVEIHVDETRSSSRTRYRKEGGVLVYKIRFVGTNDLESRSILEFGAVSNAANNAAALTAAAAAAKKISIPAGVWRWTGTITAPRVTWFIDPDATFPDLPTIGPFGQTNLESLGGRIERTSNANITFQGTRIGDGNPWPELYRPFSVAISERSVTSPSGQIAIGGFSRASDHPTVNQGTIGGEFIGLNDDEANTKPVFALYPEGWRTSDLVGCAITIEAESINKGLLHILDPWTVRTIGSKDTIAYVAASGGGDVAGVATASAAMAVWNNGAYFWKGIVAMNGSLDPAGGYEFIAMPNFYRIAWRAAAGGLIAWDQADTRQRMSQADAGTSGFSSNVKRRKLNNVSPTESLDRIFREDYYGYNGGDYFGGYIQWLQRTDFAAGTARFSCDITAKNTDGTDSQVTLNGLADKSFCFYPDNLISFGTASFRAKELFAATATVNTSDRNLKTDIRGLTDAERRVAGRCRQLFKAFRFTDAVAAKGDDARIHFGVIAQEIAAAFADEGLDGWQYGLLCSDPVMAMRPASRTVQVQKTESHEITEMGFALVDGVATRTVSVRTEETPLFETMVLHGQDGEPLEEPVFTKRAVEILDGDEWKTVHESVQTGTRLATVDVPVMEDHVETYDELYDTGEQRLGIRYTELLAFILAGEAP